MARLDLDGIRCGFVNVNRVDSFSFIIVLPVQGIATRKGDLSKFCSQQIPKLC